MSREERQERPCQLAAVLWDFDDTLVDSLSGRVDALAQVLRDTDIQHVDPRRFLLSLAGKTLEASLAQLAENLGRPADLFGRYRSVYWTRSPRTLRMYPGIEEVLDDLEQRGILLAIVTQKARSLEVEGVRAGASAELEDLGIAARFRVVMGLEDVSEPKPNPEGILRCLEQMGVTPRRAVMVGDSVADMQAAKAAGCWSCLATWGVPDGVDRARRARPDLVADAPRDILRLAAGAQGS